ncbi:MAG: hypothetical protein E6J71_02850 [Deltaproteobacteria bacterium]|nr:MAG: hypothetical protein E6J71_02850 [Deltaproteobacteria bacterium]
MVLLAYEGAPAPAFSQTPPSPAQLEKLVAPMEAELPATEGGRRITAALDASRFGRVLMVSEDDRISFMHHGHRVWQLWEAI